ncbi:hypothetical protein C0J52_16445 [Blattella germanica]|nr:hypothetical protein C0J52_16445 [Blattella germanica]
MKHVVNKKVFTEEKLNDISGRLQQSPKISLRQLAQQCGISKTLAWKATKALRMIPYHTTHVPTIAETDNASRLLFCN